MIVPITPRKPSARQNKASSDQEHTPPRAARQNPQSSSNLELAAGLQTPPTTRRRPQRFRTTLAPPTPSSAQTSPSKKRMSPRQSRNSYLDSESMQIDHANPPQITHTETASILPTPSKTPQKRQSEYLNASSTSRQLFGANEVQETDSIFPTPKRSPRKVNRKSQASHLALTLDSFEEELDHHTQSEEPKIEVFTDMRDKQPEKDASLDNPFHIDPTKAQPIIRPGRARIEGLATVTPDEYGMTREDIDEGIDRELGITYVL